MKVSQHNSADPGGKNTPFPAWVLRYANQPTALPSQSDTNLDNERAEEQNLSELDHFEEVQPTDPSELDSAEAEISPKN